MELAGKMVWVSQSIVIGTVLSLLAFALIAGFIDAWWERHQREKNNREEL